MGWIENHAELVQSAIMFFTAIIVIWYTWETRKLRIEMKTQTEILLDQLSQMIKRNVIDIEPIFDIKIPAPNLMQAQYLLIRNLGGDAYIVQIFTIPKMNLKVPVQWLEKDKEFKLRILSAPKKDSNFSLIIEYQTKDMTSTKRQVYLVDVQKNIVRPYFSRAEIIYGKRKTFLKKIFSKLIPG